jgi:hypothetical protein
MKHQMSAQLQDNLSYVFLGISVGFVKILPPNLVQAGITAGFCGAMGLLGKKAVEWAIHYMKEYFKKRNARK